MSTKQAPSSIEAYECWVEGCKQSSDTIYATSIGKAKSFYCLNASDWTPDVKYTDIRARRNRRRFVTSAGFRRMAKYRCIPFARVGMRVRVGDEMGTIVGHNSSSNLDVLFDLGSRYPGEVLNCHPHSQVTYFDEDGAEIENLLEANR